MGKIGVISIILLASSVFLLTFLVVYLKQKLIESKSEEKQIIQKMEAKIKFLATMSHEIRTPINAIIGITDILLLSDKIPSNEYAYVEKIKRATKSLLTLINDTLDITKVEANKMTLHEEEYEFSVLIKNIISIINVECLKKELTFTVDIDKNIPNKLYGDHRKIKQILINLLNNAVKFTSKGSINLKIISKYEQDNFYLDFCVFDTGYGIKEENLKTLFEEFMQYNQNLSIEGSGLGLNICNKFAHVLGSKLEVKSIYTVGTTFNFTVKQKIIDYKKIFNTSKSFKIISDDEEFKSRLDDILKINTNSDYYIIDNRRSKEKIKLSNKVQKIYLFAKENLNLESKDKDEIYIYEPFNLIDLNEAVNHIDSNMKSDLQNQIIHTANVEILIVDDNQINRLVIKNILEMFQAKVIEAESGFDALNLLKNKEYDLIFMDHIMPDMDGIETTKKIRNANIQTPIIALTADVLEESRVSFFEAKANDIINKPFEIHQIADVIRKYIEKNKILV